MNDLLKELYQEIILDHGQDPRNFGECENYNKSAKGHNPLCGDKVNVTLFLDQDGMIKEIKFSGEGCAISIASASLMTEKLKNKSLNEADKIFNDFTNLVKGQTDELKLLTEDDSLYALKGVNAFPMRVKCATMAWHTYKSAVNE
jgi:nitrogen fixation NifU-like protein|tara:strand:+ start:429 stop:863 length:435 start_codon:yes stop_codon:yes gene_type:complete